MNWKAQLNNDNKAVVIPHHSNINGTLVNTIKLDKASNTVFSDLRESYMRLKHRRGIFYKNNSCSTLDENDEKFFVEIKSFYDGLFHQHAVEPKLYLSLVMENNGLAMLEDVEKRQIFFTAAKHVQALEVLYSSWKCRKHQNASCFALPNGNFANITYLDTYMNNDTERLNDSSNVFTVYKIHVLTIVNAMEIVDAYFNNVQPTQDDLVFLLGLLVFDPTIPNISKATTEMMASSRNLLIKGFMKRSESASIDGVLRFDSLCSIIAAVKLYVPKLCENFIMLKFFNVIPKDPLFDQLWDITKNIV
uniref:NR LBD domain-containing protein n=1 Tax=Panagrellus redivivus TaxID=6233 RepID=A0A7E4ZS43_PANRE